MVEATDCELKLPYGTVRPSSAKGTSFHSGDRVQNKKLHQTVQKTMMPKKPEGLSQGLKNKNDRSRLCLMTWNIPKRERERFR
uniref:Uncharacterized protein n=1 Tax=Lactuca sativa TaxID=4236 RepID=A0A9R1WFF9_LACSA|nr:hypothetical protein LSAT_V11C200075180 [Lactuca sativa]